MANESGVFRRMDQLGFVFYDSTVIVHIKISGFCQLDLDRKILKLDTNFCIKFLQAFIIILI